MRMIFVISKPDAVFTIKCQDKEQIHLNYEILINENTNIKAWSLYLQNYEPAKFI